MITKVNRSLGCEPQMENLKNYKNLMFQLLKVSNKKRKKHDCMPILENKLIWYDDIQNGIVHTMTCSDKMIVCKKKTVEILWNPIQVEVDRIRIRPSRKIRLQLLFVLDVL